MRLLRRDALLATPLSLSDARARLVEAVRTPADGDEAAGAPLSGWIEGWEFEVEQAGARRRLPVAARGSLHEQQGETRIALSLRPGRVALAIVLGGLLLLSVGACVAAVVALVASTRRGAPQWVGALGLVLPGMAALGWLSLWDAGFQREAGRMLRDLSALFEARPAAAGAAA